MSGYEWVWLAWALAVIGSFFAFEIPGVRNKSRRMDTLTENLRKWFGFAGNGRGRVWWRQVLFLMLSVGGALSLVMHLFGLI